MHSGGEEKVTSAPLLFSIRTFFGVASIAPWLVLVFGLALSWLLWNMTQQQAQKKLQDYFDFRVHQAVSLTEQRVHAQEQILRGVLGLFIASVSVERNEFRDYVATLHLDENYPGIQGVGYAQIIPRKELSKHIEVVRKESGHLEYMLRPEGERDFYTSIVYLEPFSGRNLRAFGYDMYSDPVRRAAMERARDTGMASLSEKVLLVQETDQQPQAGFLIYLPVYRNGALHETVQERRANIIGWVYSPFRMGDLAQGMYGERAKDLDIEIYDGEMIASDALMYDSNRDHKARFQDLSSVQHLNMHNHTWTLSIHSVPLFHSREEQNESTIVAFVGIGFSLLFAILTWLLVTGRERAIPYALEMNRELILKEQALRKSEERLRLALDTARDAVITLDAENGAVTEWNPAAEAIFGMSKEEVIGRVLHEIITPLRFRKAASKGLAHFAATGEGAAINKTLELMALHKNGTEFPIELSLSPMKIDGKWQATAIARDITERKQAEISLVKSNRALAALSAVNHSLVHSTDEHELLLAVCQAIVRQSSYRMAWVGYLEQDAAKIVRPIAQDGFDEGYLEHAEISWADTEHGRGPTGRAARSGQTQVAQNIQTDASMLLWRAEATKRGMASSIALPLIEAGKVFGVLTIYSGNIDAFGKEEVSLLEEMAGDLTFGILSLSTRLERDEAQIKIKNQLIQLEANLEDTVKAITNIVEMRDPYTAGHEARVAELAVAIAKEMGIPDEQVHGIHLAAVVHDLGKIQVPAEILSKPARLTEIEYSLIKGHPQAGYDILKDIGFTWPIAQMVLQHHERMDGSGYPQGLKGEAILIEARILCVADVVEAMSSHRPYRPGLGIEVALSEIEKNRGTLYDAKVVDACLKVFGEGQFKF